MKDQVRCSIIIRCFNEVEHIGKLLVGIGQQTVKDVEVIVVDSGSTDGTLDVATRWPVRVVTIDSSEFSFGRSLNRGCGVAHGEVLVVVSAHVYPVHEDWLEQLIRPFEDPRIAITYGKQRGDRRTKYSEHQLFRRWFPEESDLEQAIPFCNNANAAVRRSLWESMPYDEALSGLEDLDLAKRALANGSRVAYVSEAEVIHVHEETPARILNRYRREAMAMGAIFPEARFGVLELLKLIPANVISDIYHAAHDGVLARNLLDILMFRTAQFWGAYLGYNHTPRLTNHLKGRFYYPNALQRAHENDPDHARQRIDYDATHDPRGRSGANP